jgi:bifunctional non-homologous end joining protein LigD
VQVCSRRGPDFTDRFQRIAEAVRGLSAAEAMIDGEAVVFQDDGLSDFVCDSVPTCQKRQAGPDLLAMVGEPSAV